MAKRWSGTDWGEKVIIVMIGIEILLSLGTITLTIHEANGQDKLLRQIVGVQTKVDSDLADMDSKLRDLDAGMTQTAKAVTASATTSSNINAALQSQLHILAQEQKQQSDELARKPEIHALVGTVRLDATNQSLTPKEISDTKAIFEIVVQNSGNLVLIGGLVRIAVDDANIKLSAPYSSPIPAPSGLAKMGTGISVPLARLSHSAWELIVLTAEYPRGTLPFDITLTVDGDKLPLTPLGGLHVRPPAPVSPFAPPR